MLNLFPSINKIPSNYQFVNTRKSNSPQATTKSGPVHFQGKKVEFEDLFMRPAHIYDPFESKAERIESDPQYDKIVKEWQDKAKNNWASKAVKIGISTAGAIAGTLMGDKTGNEAEGAGLGTALSGVVNLAVKPTIEYLTMPELEEKRKALRAKSKELGPNGYVATSASRIRRNVEPASIFDGLYWANQEVDSTALLKGLISRYGREQAHVRRLLPSIKGKDRTKTVVVPYLEDNFRHLTSRASDLDYRIGYAGEPARGDMIDEYTLLNEYIDRPKHLNPKKGETCTWKFLEDNQGDLIDYLKDRR